MWWNGYQNRRVGCCHLGKYLSNPDGLNIRRTMNPPPNCRRWNGWNCHHSIYPNCWNHSIYSNHWNYR